MVMLGRTASRRVDGVLEKYRRGDLISTHKAIAAIRKKQPELAPMSDDLLTALLVASATRRGMYVMFDHKE